MRNAETTKEHIIKESANLFNTQGYKATSLSDITKATGFTKGAIYRHFENKLDLEQQALQLLSKIMFEELAKTIRQANTFQSKFEAIFSFFENYMNTPLFEGGCPLLNVAVEADDSHPGLRLQANDMLIQFKEAISILFKNGIKNNQVKVTVDCDYYSTIIIATLEGGIMMSKLQQDKKSLITSIKHLRSLVNEITV